MIVGKFTDENGVYTGDILAGLTTISGVTIKPDRNSGSGRPDYRVATPCGELGAGWKKTSTRGNSYISIRLDSPFLPAPVNCALIRQAGNSHALVWSRDSRSENSDAE